MTYLAEMAAGLQLCLRVVTTPLQASQTMALAPGRALTLLAAVAMRERNGMCTCGHQIVALQGRQP